MKRSFITIIPFLVYLLIGITTNVMADEVRTFNFNHGKADGIQIVQQSKGDISLNFTLNTLQVSPIDYKGEVMHEVGVSGIILPNAKGMPNVPTYSKIIAIPQGAEAVINIVNYEKEIIQNINIAPSRGIEPQVVEPTVDYVKNDLVYSKDEFYPSSYAGIGEYTTLRGIDIITLNISPIQFNPITKEAVVYHNIELTIEYKGGNSQFGDNAYRSPYFDPILAQNILNYNDLPKIDYEARFQEWIKDGSEGYEYIIVTPNNDAWAPYAQQLADLRTKQGILTKVYRLDEMGVTNTNQLKAWFHDAYYNWEIKPVAVCLMGDHNTDMSQGIPAEVISHSYSGSCITDNQYADPDGNLLPDITFSRLIAQDESELPIFVGKQIEYEVNNPNMDAHSYQYPVTALGWQTERWFQICSEVAGGYFRNLGKEPLRINQIYEGSPDTENIWSDADNTDLVIDYFGPNGLGYIPATPGEMGNWNNGSPQQIVDAINEGTFIVQHRDHGLETGWGEPAFRNSHVEQLTNVGKLPFVMSINCLTGKYNLSSTCFAEKFMRHTYNGQNAGAVGMLCPTEVSYSFVNDVYVWGVYDQFDSNFLPDMGPFASYEDNWFPAFGNVAGKYFLYQCSWPYNYYDKEITYQMFTAHCDAFLRLYTEVPQTMDVVHQDVQLAGHETFTITAPEYSKIALSVTNEDGEIEIIAVADGTGKQQNITIPVQLPPTIINLVVTGQNYLRYEAEIEVIPADGPYLIIDSYQLGNNNEQLDFGETATMNLVFRNVGNDPSENATATISSESDYITIINPIVSFEGLASDNTISIENAFEFIVSDSVPNNTSNKLSVEIVSGNETFQSNINVKAYAPVLKASNVSITEIDGNGNGKLDPAETATLTFTIDNKGNSRSNDIFYTLNMNNVFIEILSDPVTTEGLNAGETTTVSFDVFVGDGTPMGYIAEYTLDCISGYYNTSTTFKSKVGCIIEDFETGDLSKFNWNNTSNIPWTLTNSDTYEGNYCIKSGQIQDYGTTDLILEYESIHNDTISFYVKVSSEHSYDELTFYIDNQEIQSWSGQVSWTLAAFPTSEGIHTYKWSYHKDSSVSNGSDCAWIDLISLPADKRMAISAGLDINTCPDMVIEINGYADYHSSLEWTTQGDGTFNNNTIINPTYTLGNQDIENGEVTLTLTGTDEDGQTLSDNVKIILMGDPTITTEENAQICFNENYKAEVDVTNYLSVSWSTNGDGTFINSNVVDAIYQPGIQDIENGEVILTISVNGCSNIDQNITVSILGETTIDVDEEVSICGNEPVMISAIVDNAETIIWSTNGDGTFDDSSSAEITYTPGSQDIINGGVVLTITAEGCSSATKDIVLSVKDGVSLLNIDSETTVCPNTIAEINAEFTGEAPFTVIANDSEYQILEDNIMRVETGSDSMILNITDVFDANGCHLALSNTININVINIATPERPMGENVIAKDDNNVYTYQITAIDGINTYEWVIEPAEAGNIENNGNEAIITWNLDYNGNAQVMVRAIDNDCYGEFSEPLSVFSSLINVDEINDESIQIYPNPAYESINVKIHNLNNKITTINIFNILGEMVYTNEFRTTDNSLETNINVNNLNSGSYIMTITSDNITWRKQIIIK